jgi:hypothetical protein
MTPLQRGMVIGTILVAPFWILVGLFLWWVL